MKDAENPQQIKGALKGVHVIASEEYILYVILTDIFMCAGSQFVLL